MTALLDPRPAVATPAPVPAAPAPAGPFALIFRAEQAVLRILRAVSVPALRVALGVVFVWFGGLKVIGESPIADLVASMLPFLPADTVVIGLGVFEVIAGLALIAGFLTTWVSAAIVAHLGATFLVGIVHPSAVFTDGNPLLATMEGEFIAKNLVLIAAAMVVAAFAKPRGT
ncbi:MAG TPA: DoxX family protein, partial [Naasia sp.]